MLEVLFTILWLEKGLTSFNKDISTNFSGEKKVQWSFPRRLFFESQILFS